MTPEHRWLIVIPREFSPSERQRVEEMRSLLEDRFPAYGFFFCREDEIEDEAARPGPGRPLSVAPILGSERGGLGERPPMESQQEVQDYVEFLVRERLKLKALDRWTNEGGAIGKEGDG